MQKSTPATRSPKRTKSSKSQKPRQIKHSNKRTVKTSTKHHRIKSASFQSPTLLPTRTTPCSISNTASPHQITTRKLSTLPFSTSFAPNSISHFQPSKSLLKSLPIPSHLNTLPLTTTTHQFSSSNQHITPNNCSDPLIADFFRLLNKGLTPMLDSNPGMQITTDGDVYECDFGQDIGIYHFTRSSNEEFLKRQNREIDSPIMVMMSPISGNAYQYYYDKKRFNQWISIDDEHYMVELLTRELLKKCYGYPMF